MNDFIIISNGYPSYDKLYNNAFIHSRVKQYIEHGYKGFVIILRPENKKLTSYSFEGVTVYQGNSDNIKKLLEENKKSHILIHFVDIHMINAIKKIDNKFNIIIWIHGTEALGWKRRLFNLRLNLKSILSFIKYVYCNTKQMKFMRNLILDKNLNVKFIFVSEWMREILEQDTKTTIEKDKYEIIPNVINENLFSYIPKAYKDKINILSIRPYSSRKYANDITVNVILELSKKEYFNRLNFNLYGDGEFFEKTLKPLRKFNNVNIHKTFLTQQEVKKMHDINEIILSPTRQDAQGVSMCEAMSSGLIPVVSNNTAIPEFVKNEFGYLCNDVNDFISAFDDIYTNRCQLQHKSKMASDFISNKCGNHIIEDELKVIKLHK